MICIDLMYEWLWEFRNKVTPAEYLIGLSTFGLIQFLGVEYGIVAGVAVYVLCRQLKIDVGELKQVYIEEDDDGKNVEGGGHHLEVQVEEPQHDEYSNLISPSSDENGSSYITF